MAYADGMSNGKPRTLPYPIDDTPENDTPENIAKAVLNTPPKTEWRYLDGRTADTDKAVTDTA